MSEMVRSATRRPLGARRLGGRRIGGLLAWWLGDQIRDLSFRGFKAEKLNANISRG